ncbi:MAG: cytochrome c [Desulfobacteraceae bacterium]|jgi:cytochrome c556|nr:cytochrome c [Desulfobacteraceae bacterium]
MRISLKVVTCGIVLAAMGGLAFAGFAKPEDAIRYRQAVMTVIGQHFGSLAAVVKGQAAYNKDSVEHDAAVLRTMSELAWEAVMVPGSDRGDTTLSPLAMKEPDKFMAVAQQFESAVQQLEQTAKSGDIEAVKGRFGEVAKSCKFCHSTYRKN